METCFVMQPFDGDSYDKRYESVFAPAILAAGLEPYRVDQDPSVSIPIEDIEKGIRNARICFAEITEDNPNVWFELGYAIACSKATVLVCSEERQNRRFPFDIQHRAIITYLCGAPQDFDDVKVKITERITALLAKEATIASARRISPVKDTEGLSSHEIVALVTVMQNECVTGAWVPISVVVTDMNQAGFTDIATALAMTTLDGKGFLQVKMLEPFEEVPFRAASVTDSGKQWLLEHQSLLKLREPEVPF